MRESSSPIGSSARVCWGYSAINARAGVSQACSFVFVIDRRKTLMSLDVHAPLARSARGVGATGLAASVGSGHRPADTQA